MSAPQKANALTVITFVAQVHPTPPGRLEGTVQGAILLELQGALYLLEDMS